MFRIVPLLTLVAAATAVDFEFINKEGGPVWVGIQGNSGHSPLSNGGFKLAQGESRTVGAPDNWAGRFWPRTYCNSGTNHCLTGDCGNKVECAGNGGNPPASLAEITLKGDAGKDFYDISLVDGFNIPISIEPVGGQGDGSQYSCKKAACASNLNDNCPDKLKLKTDSGVLGCKSSCLVFNTDSYCCRGSYSTKCSGTDWQYNYPKYIKDRCPDAYSYAFDDDTSLFTCKAAKYTIVFGI